MNKQLIQINRKISANMIRREVVDGDDAIIIRSATLPDDVVMNGGLYSAEEIEKSYKDLDRKPAPLGHPAMNGKFISASDPYAMHNFDVGAYVTNVSREDGRVFHDTVINVRVANQSEKGKKVLEAIENMEKTGEPIHTSTGIYLNRRELDQPAVNAKGVEYTWIAEDIKPDHNAILINQEGAATPEQGVGLAVNSAGEELELMISNEEDYQYKQEPEANEEKELQGMFKSMVSFIKNMSFAPNIDSAYNENSNSITTNSEEGLEMTPEELKAALAEQATALQANFDKSLASAVSDIKSLNDKISALEANAQNADAIERAPLVEKAKLKSLTQEEVDAMSTNALKVMLGVETKKTATYPAGGEPSVNGKEDDAWKGYDLNANLEAK